MEDIQNQQITGRIYKIISGLTDDVYVGSTVLPLHQRFSTHVSNYKLFNEGKYGNSKKLPESYEGHRVGHEVTI